MGDNTSTTITLEEEVPVGQLHEKLASRGYSVTVHHYHHHPPIDPSADNLGNPIVHLKTATYSILVRIDHQGNMAPMPAGFHVFPVGTRVSVEPI